MGTAGWAAESWLCLCSCMPVVSTAAVSICQNAVILPCKVPQVKKLPGLKVSMECRVAFPRSSWEARRMVPIIRPMMQAMLPSPK